MQVNKPGLDRCCEARGPAEGFAGRKVDARLCLTSVRVGAGRDGAGMRAMGRLSDD